MMEAESLRSAGDYLNNILLARGRLAHGKSIDFVQLAAPKDDAQRSENIKATVQIINLIHDLTISIDAQDEHNESVALTLRGLKADLSGQTEANTQLERQRFEHERRCRQLERENAAHQAQVQQTGATLRKCREELTRAKTTLEQVRTQCAADLRRRDGQIEKLKSHLTTQQRGNRSATVAPHIAITPGNIGTGQRLNGQSKQADVPSVEDVEYSLTQESTQFLTQLCQDLSNENDLLLDTLKRTTDGLRRTLQMPKCPQTAIDRHSAVGDAQVQIMTASHDQIISELDSLVGSAVAILTNPTFVSIEEAEEGYTARDQEIEGLKEGLAKMEQRLRDAIHLSKSLRLRVAAGEPTDDLAELMEGLVSEANCTTEPELHTVSHTGRVPTFHVEDHDFGAPQRTEEDCGPASLEIQPTEESSADETEDLIRSRPQETRSENVATAGSVPGRRQLQDVNPNEAGNSDRGGRKASKVAQQDQENGSHLSAQSKSNAPKASTPVAPIAKQVTVRRNKSRTTSVSSRIPRTTTLTRRAPSPEEDKAPSMSVPEKLKFAAEEARRVSLRSSTSDDPELVELEEPSSDLPPMLRSPVRKSGVFGRPSRRRKSTLSPDELEKLMLDADAA